MAGPSYPYADIVAFHGYVQQTAEKLPQLLPAFKQVLSQHGLGDLPIWDTEGSFEEDSKLTPQAAANFVLPYLVTQAAAGVSRVFWYAYDNCVWGSLYSSALCESYYHTPPPSSSLGPTSAGSAYATAESWLSGAALDSCRTYDNGLWICGIERPGGHHAWVIWVSSWVSGVTSVSVPVPGNLGLLDYRDGEGHVVTDVPAQLTATPSAILAEAHTQ